jgi:hypothetical protein
MPPAGVSLLCGPTVNLLSVTCTAVSFPWCQSVLMLSLLSVSFLRSRFVDFSFSFSCNSVSISVSCLGFFVMNSVTGLVGVSVCFPFGD